MAPRRNHNNNSSIVHLQQPQAHHHHQQQSLYSDLESQQQQQQQQQPQQQEQNPNDLSRDTHQVAENTSSITGGNNNINNMSPMQTTHSNGIVAISNIGNNSNTDQQQQQQFTRCCYPNGDCLQIDSLIMLSDLSACVRVLCNNENCNIGQYMHRECFENFEQSVLNTLKANGRARAWSDRQRTQNLWTKKGYDLIYKACGCKCGRGHLRKDLEWSAPASNVSNGMKNASTLLFVNGSGTGSANGSCGNVAVSNGVLLNGNAVNGQRSATVNSLSNGNAEDDDKKKKKRNRNKQLKNGSPVQQQQQQNGFGSNQQQQQPQLLNSNSSNLNQTNNQDLMPNPNVGVIGSGLHASNNNSNNTSAQMTPQQKQQQQQQQNLLTINNLLNGNAANVILGLDLRARAGSLSSSGAGSGSTSPAASQSSIDVAISPIHHGSHHQQQQQQQQLQQLAHYEQQQQNAVTLQQQQQQMNGLSKRLLNGFASNLLAKQQQQQQQSEQMLPNTLSANQQQQQQQQQQVPQQQQQLISNGFKQQQQQQQQQQLSPFDQQQLILQQKVKEVEIYSERVRSTSGCNGIFSRRLDFSSFNLLPKTRLNSYQVKIEDEGNHGNDETRLFILSSLAQSQRSRVACILCEENMLVFDRYPLVDGSFFLSPKQHSPGCIEVKYEGRTLYLTCVCMSCLDGSSSNRVISCRFCAEVWDGSNLVLGTMYAYDIFAAMPCCAERIKCNNCFKLLLHPQQRLSFYSDYSHCVTCPYCATQDTHFVKPLTYCYTKSNAGSLGQIA